MVDVSNIYDFKGTVNNPSSKTIVQFQAPQYQPLTLLRVEISRRESVDEMFRIGIVRKSAAASLPNSPTFGTDIVPHDDKLTLAVDPGFRTATNTKWGVATAEGTNGSIPWSQSFHTKIGGLWVPPIDPELKEYKPYVINYGEIYAITFLDAPSTSGNWDFVVTIKEG